MLLHENEFEYARLHNRYKYNKRIITTLLVNAVFILISGTILIYDIIQANPYGLISSVIILGLLIYFYISFVIKLNFTRIQTNVPAEMTLGEIDFFLKLRNIHYEVKHNNRLVIINSRLFSSGINIHEQIYIIINNNSIQVNNYIKGTSLINTGWHYPNKKQSRILINDLKSFMNDGEMHKSITDQMQQLPTK